MDTRTLEALKASIAKWGRNVEATKEHEVLLGVSDCPLCKIFWKIDRDESCVGCPVFDAGHFRCGGTPYDDAENAYTVWDDEGGSGNRDTFRHYAQAEVDFLKSLLPEESSHA